MPDGPEQRRIVQRPIEEEMERSYIDYAMSVIVGRALPDVRDGLKPVHRRVLHAMNELGTTSGAAYKKSARIVGESMGKFHPHGDAPVYDSLVRMAQTFSLRYPLIQGQGNFGCFTGDTRIRLLDGRDLSFAELSQEFGPKDTFYVYSVSAREGRITVGSARNPRVTRPGAQIMELVLDNSERIRCTPDHRFLLRDGSYKQASELTESDSLMPGYFSKARVNEETREYLTIVQPRSGATEFVHHIVDRWNEASGVAERFNGPYSEGFDAMLDETSRYNHRVIRKHLLRESVDVWDITVDVHHNFLLSAGVFVHNSVDGDPPAAMRYTEVRLSKIAEDMLQDIEKDTVDMVDNFDGTLKEPTVLPSKFPNLLVNGSSGIAVGMATNIPPHNLGEIVDALVALIDNPDLDVSQLVNYETGPIRGPDFPTGGVIHGFDGVWEAYKSGRGQFRVRGRYEMEGEEGDRRVVFSEIPYMVNKSALLQSIAELVKEKRIDGVSDLRDESDREGIRIVIELKKDAIEDVVLNQLFAHTALQSTFGVINLSLVDGEPKTLPLKDTLREYVRYREHVVRRRTQFDLNKARAREHIVEGLITAVDHLDEVITLIRRSRDTDAAKEGLMRRYLLSEEQVKAILDMRLQRLTGLAIDELREERRELEKTIAELESILASETRILGIIKEELLELKGKYGDPRRTDIVPQALDFEIEDIIPNEANVVTISNTGYVKRSLVKSYRQQRRAGKGATGMGTKEEDYVVNLFIAYSHDYILFFTNRGRLYWLKTYRIPEVGRAAKGKPIVNLLPGLDKDEHVQAMIPVREFTETRFLVFATKQGVIKRTNLSAFRHVTIRGVHAIRLEAGDELIDVQVADGDEEVLLATAGGYANRFSIRDVRPMGRVTTGVWGIRLYPGNEVVAMTLSKNPEAELLTVLASGFGKRTKVASYRKTRRGSHGVMTTNMKIAKSRVVTVRVVHEDDALLVTTMNGMVIRCPVKGIRVTGRAARGVRIMKVEDGDKVMAVARLISEKEEEQAVEAAEAAPPPEPPRPQPEIGPPGDEPEEDVEPEDTEPEGDEPEELEL